jgi:hypothetical protein
LVAFGSFGWYGYGVVEEYKITSFEQTHLLLKEFPEWFPVLQVCLEQARRGTTDRFAGSWVVWKLQQMDIKPPNNLRKLTSFGILVKTHTTRAGKRAYYVMPDPNGVEKALFEFSKFKSEK